MEVTRLQHPPPSHEATQAAISTLINRLADDNDAV